MRPEDAFSVAGEANAARKRSFLSDTMQFMPQASTTQSAQILDVMDVNTASMIGWQLAPASVCLER